MIQATLLILNAVGGFFVTLCLLRFLMQAAHVPFNTSLGQFVLQLTHGLIGPLRRVTPSWRGYDLSCLVAAYLLEVLVLGLTILITGNSMLEVLPATDLVLLVLWHGVTGLVRRMVYIAIGAVIAQAILSWVSPFSPVMGMLERFTTPLLGPLRRHLPPIAGIDLSPLVFLLLAQVLLIFL